MGTTSYPTWSQLSRVHHTWLRSCCLLPSHRLAAVRAVATSQTESTRVTATGLALATRALAMGKFCFAQTHRHRTKPPRTCSSRLFRAHHATTHPLAHHVRLFEPASGGAFQKSLASACQVVYV